MTKIAVSLLLLTLSTACIKTADQVHREQRLDTVAEQFRDSQNLVADLMNKMQDLQKQIDKLNGQLEEVEHRQGQVNPENIKMMSETLSQMKTQQEAESTQLLQIQNELKEQRTFIEKVTATLEKLGKQQERPEKKKSDKERIAEALELVRQDKYSAARTELETLVGEKLSAVDLNKVLHGLGRVEFYTKNYEKALVYFSKIYSKYPKSSLAPSSLLFIGRSLQKLGKKDEAKEAFAKVVEDYPDKKEAREAKKEL